MAVATGNYVPLIHASQGNLCYVASAPTYSDASAIAAIASILDLQVITCKNMTITPPKGEVSKVDLLGTCSTTTGAGVPSTGVFQNCFMEEKSWSNGMLKGTLALTFYNDGTAAKLPDFINLVTGTGTAVSTTYHKHTFGDSTASQTRVKTGAILVRWYDGTQEGLALLNAPYVNLGDIKPTGTDGHWEIDFEAECLPQDFVLEVKDKDS